LLLVKISYLRVTDDFIKTSKKIKIIIILNVNNESDGLRTILKGEFPLKLLQI
jgi:hypothetical protein